MKFRPKTPHKSIVMATNQRMESSNHSHFVSTQPTRQSTASIKSSRPKNLLTACRFRGNPRSPWHFEIPSQTHSMKRFAQRSTVNSILCSAPRIYRRESMRPSLIQTFRSPLLLTLEIWIISILKRSIILHLSHQWNRKRHLFALPFPRH